MLTRLDLSADSMPIIKKTVDGKDASSRGSFPCGAKVEFTALTPRILGASAVVLRISEDAGEERDLPFTFEGTQAGVDNYTLVLDTAKLCSTKEHGLFYYEILFIRGEDTLFTSTWNFVDFSLERTSGGRFILLVHTPEFSTPEWFRGRIMYHVFVDRFCRGEGEVGTRDDAIMNGDWHEGMMQFALKPGDPLANNMFFGGNLWGVAQKLDYLKSLGVGVIYLSPIFKAYSNHKYDTGDYLKIDEMFGGEAAFENLLEKARQKDIYVILDGVFNHTGDDSLYFDRYSNYGGVGAYSCPSSEYRNWFRFKEYPRVYESWWGIEIMPRLNHTVPECRKFFTAKGGVTEKYVKMGIGGWRLDVADELSDEFLDEMRATVKAASGGKALIIGEVWENAAEKIAYSSRRRYLRGAQLDSVMNYPVRNAILALLVDKDAEFFADVLKSVYASYPKCVCDCLMNLLGTHDTERILTVLGEGNADLSGVSNIELSKRRLTKEVREKAIKLQKIAATVQYTVYGVPSVFYGDEAGVEGYHDPFCRKTYPWGRECEELLSHYRKLGEVRANNSLFADGEFCMDYAKDALVAYSRYDGENKLQIVVNASESVADFDAEGIDLLTGKPFDGKVAPLSAYILK